MEENFDLLAQSRANYYTKGSPIQFVKVELLKGDVTGDIAVCLSFKNITNQPIVALLVQFKCKDRQGAIICQDEFCYQGLDTSSGKVFGSDDAVFIGDSNIGSVEVDLLEAYLADGGILDLTGYSRVRLPAPKKLPADVAAKLEQRVRKTGLAYVPQVLDQGWYCACGAFHPREEEGVWCSECTSDRILLQNTLSSLLQQNATPAQPATDEQPTRTVPHVRSQQATRTVPPAGRQSAQYAEASYSQGGYNVPPMQAEDEDVKIAEPRSASRAAAAAQNLYGTAAECASYEQDSYEDEYQQGYEQDEYEEDYYEEEMDPRDVTAEKIIRWAPPITAVLCAIVVIVGLAMMQ